MLPKKNRLLRQDFKKVFKKGKRVNSDSFVLFYLNNPQIKAPQVGIITGLKIGKAVKRNKVKRRLREIIRLEISQIPSTSQLILLCRPSIISKGFQELQEEVNSALSKLALKPI